MKAASTRSFIAAGLAVFWLAGPALSGQEKQRIKVVVENASIRLKPDASSEIMANPPVGTIYDVEARVGEWYEIRHSTRVGVLVTGYIHEMFVEVVKTAVEKKVPVGEAAAPVAAERPAVPGTETAPGVKLGISLGGIYAGRAGYDHNYAAAYYGETFRLADTVTAGGAGGFSLGLAVIFNRIFEIAAGLDIVSGKMDGLYSIDLPNILIYNDIAHAEAEERPAATAMELGIGVAYHPVRRGKVDPYFGAGASYIMAKMKIVKDLIYNDTYYSDNTHTLEITEVQFGDENPKTFGMYFRAGLHFQTTPWLSLFAEGKYVLAKTEIDHPLMLQLGVTDTVKIDLGGFSVRLGLRFLL